MAGGEASDTKAEGVSVSTQTVGLEDPRTVLVGMVLRAVGSEVVVMEAAEEDLVHQEVAVGMEVGTVPTLNGRAQGWTRIVIQSDQGIEHIFSGVPSGSHHGVSLPECFSAYSLSLARGLALASSDMLCKYPVLSAAVRMGKISPLRPRGRNYHIMFSNSKRILYRQIIPPGFNWCSSYRSVL